MRLQPAGADVLFGMTERQVLTVSEAAGVPVQRFPGPGAGDWRLEAYLQGLSVTIGAGDGGTVQEVELRQDGVAAGRPQVPTLLHGVDVFAAPVDAVVEALRGAGAVLSGDPARPGTWWVDAQVWLAQQLVPAPGGAGVSDRIRRVVLIPAAG